MKTKWVLGIWLLMVGLWAASACGSDDDDDDSGEWDDNGWSVVTTGGSGGSAGTAGTGGLIITTGGTGTGGWPGTGGATGGATGSGGTAAAAGSITAGSSQTGGAGGSGTGGAGGMADAGPCIQCCACTCSGTGCAGERFLESLGSESCLDCDAECLNSCGASNCTFTSARSCDADPRCTCTCQCGDCAAEDITEEAVCRGVCDTCSAICTNRCMQLGCRRLRQGYGSCDL